MATKITGNTYPVKEQLKALGGKWNSGEKCWEVPDDKAAEARALVSPTPIYNSPPPLDLGTAGPDELAAKFGRVAVAAAKVGSYTGYGKTPDADGTVHHAKKSGKRILQVAHGKPRYYSRDMLDDFDMFNDQPGYQYQWDGVEVEPTGEEAAADAQAAAAKAEAERLKQEAADRAKAEREAADRAFAAAIEGLELTTVAPAESTDTDETLPTGDHRAIKVLLPDGRACWRRSWSSHDDSRTYWYLPADVAAAARLAWAREHGITPEGATEWLARYDGCEGTDLYRAVVAAVEADPVAADELRRWAAAKAEADRAEARAKEEEDLGRYAGFALEALGLREPRDEYTRKQWAAKVHPLTPEVLASWELRTGPGFEAYVEGRMARKWPTLPGAVLVLRLRPAAFAKPSPRSKKPSPAEALPAELKLHNYCTAALLIERSDS